MRKNGFTLIEIVVTAVIIGVLAVMVLPNFKTTIDRSYAQDAMRNLMTIYSAQQEYSQNNNGSYVSLANLAAINNSITGLNLGIVSNGGTNYSCTTTICTATANSFTMDVTLASPISVQPNVKYCNGTATNPCCRVVAGTTAGNTCP